MAIERKMVVATPSPLQHLPDTVPVPSPEMMKLPGVAAFHRELQEWWFNAKTVMLRQPKAPDVVAPVAKPTKWNFEIVKDADGRTKDIIATALD